MEEQKNSGMVALGHYEMAHWLGVRGTSSIVSQAVAEMKALT